MNDLLFLMKFHEHEWAEKFAKGDLYFNTPKHFREIELETKKRGQGDKYDGMLTVPIGNITLGIDMGITNQFTPTLCLTGCFMKDVCKHGNKAVINFSKKTRQDIIEHFPNADTVAIITHPLAFISELTSQQPNVVVDKVAYFNKNNIEDAFIFIVNRDLPRIGDPDFFKKIKNPKIKERIPIIKNGTHHFTITTENAYNSLFVKDDYFSNEQEVRIILKDNQIQKGEVFKTEISEKIKTYSIGQVFSGNLEINMF